MKTGHFERGIAQQAAIAALILDEPTQREPATFYRTLAAKGWSARKIARKLHESVRLAQARQSAQLRQFCLSFQPQYTAASCACSLRPTFALLASRRRSAQIADSK